ncbi:MAG: citrate synthase [Bacteroidetes bacterium]|nr:MAG: citrate synthase [Bacteroidota bacterium]
MNETVEMRIGKETYSLPVVTGTYNEKGIDISQLLSQTKHVTLDTGFKNTGSTMSSITFIDGAKGILQHRGYPIEQLADQATFTELMLLLLNGELPTQQELSTFEDNLKAHVGLKGGLKRLLDAMPENTHPMCMLSVMVNALPGFYRANLDSWSDEQVRWDSIYFILANLPVMTAYIYRHHHRLAYIDPDPSLGYVENFLYMMFGEVDEDVADALDALLVLHGDHEQNCSAATVRVAGSSHVNLFSAIGAGVNALWGPLHGGANQAVLEMLEAIREDGGDVERYINKAKDKDDPFRLMGFGHRVYKNYDPRARVIKKYVDRVLGKLGKEDPVVDIAKGLEKAALADDYFSSRKLFPNVDFYSGIIYRAMGIPVDMFTVMFALGRLPGWISQWAEMRTNNEPIGRPRQVYIGPATRDYVPIDQR